MIDSLKQMDEVTDFKLSRKGYRTTPAGEVELVGKWSICAQLADGTWDVWLCNPENMAEGLTQRKVSGIRASLDALGRPTGPFKQLTGEGVYLGMPLETMLLGARLLGLRVRRSVSPEQREIARQRFAKMKSEKLASRFFDTYGHLDFHPSAEEVIEGGEFTKAEVDRLVEANVLEWDET